MILLHPSPLSKILLTSLFPPFFPLSSKYSSFPFPYTTKPQNISLFFFFLPKYSRHFVNFLSLPKFNNLKFLSTLLFSPIHSLSTSSPYSYTLTPINNYLPIPSPFFPSSNTPRLLHQPPSPPVINNVLLLTSFFIHSWLLSPSTQFLSPLHFPCFPL